jgi:hypothetical protein
MAKVDGPLFSMTASGAFGKAVVYQKNGNVRKYVVPSNPQTVAQMAVRNKLKEIQKSLKLLGTVLRTELASGFGARWNSMIVGELTADGGAALTGYVAEFTAFQAGEKTAWATADTSNPTILADGAALYACASAIYDMAIRLGVTVSLTLPANDNAVTVGAEWIDSTP